MEAPLPKDPPSNKIPEAINCKFDYQPSIRLANLVIEIEQGADLPQNWRNLVKNLAKQEFSLSIQEIEMFEMLLKSAPTTSEANSIINVGAYLEKRAVTVRYLAKTIKAWNIPARNNNYVKRLQNDIDLIEQIRASFVANNFPVKLVTLYGLGGIGKTQLALAYIQKYQESYHSVYWFHADNKDRLITEYINFGREHNLFNENDKNIAAEEKAKRVRRWLENNEPIWLIVLDNPHKYDEITDLLPTRGGHILITSRHKEWPETCFSINVFSNKEAKDFAKKIIGSEKIDRESINLDTLNERLGYLPLALAQAYAYIKRSNKSIEDYLTLYENSKKVLLAKNLLPAGDKHDPVAVTWNITLVRMREESPHSVELLYFCAHLYHQAIPIGLVKYFFKDLDEIIIDDTHRIANEYSMITVYEKNHTFSIHSLVQGVMRIQLTDQKEEIKYLINQMQSLNIIFPAENVLQTSFDLIRQLKPHLEEGLKYIDDYLNSSTKRISDSLQQNVVFQREILVRILIDLAKCYETLGFSQKRNNLALRALSIAEKYQVDEEFKAIILHHIGNACGDLGDVRGQIFYLDQALINFQKYHKEGKIWTAMTLQNLSNAYGDLGDPQKQKTLLEDALKILEIDKEKYQLEIAGILNNLANAYGSLGDPIRKKDLLIQALNIYKVKYTKNNIKIAIAIANLGVAWGEMGDHFKQKQLSKDALKILKEFHKEDKINLARTTENLAISYGVFGKLAKKKKLLEQALTIKEKHYGKDHVEYAKTLGNLGKVYFELGQLADAKSYLDVTLNITEQFYGKNNIQVAIVKSNVGAIYELIGKYVEAEKLLVDALSIYENFYEKDNYRLIDILVNLSSLYGDTDRKIQQIRMLKRAKDIAEKHYGKDHVEMADILRNLANTYEAAKKMHKRVIILKRALELKEKHFCKDHIQTANILESLAVTYGEMKDFNQEQYLLEQVLAIKEKFYSRMHPEVATVLTNIGVNYANIKDYATARKLCEEAYNIFLHHPNCGENHINTKKAKYQLDCLNHKIPSQQKDEIFQGVIFRGIFVKPTVNTSYNILKELIEKYKLSDTSQANLEKCLRMAATNNQVGDLIELVKAGVNVDGRDNNPQSKKTALHWATIKKAKECIKKLLENGAQLNIKDASGKTAYDYASEANDNELLTLLSTQQNKFPSLQR